VSYPAGLEKAKRKDAGVNLGRLYLPIKAVEESPVFSQSATQSHFTAQTDEKLHVALVKIRRLQSIGDEALRGIGLTLSQLSKLGLSCTIVIDYDEAHGKGRGQRISLTHEQADRIVDAIDAHGAPGARRLDNIIGISANNQECHSAVRVNSTISVMHRDLLLAPLRRGVIPIIAPVAFMPDTHTMVPVEADEVVLALTREFAGIPATPSTDDDPNKAAEKSKILQTQVSLDRIIVLDPLGGIPSADRSHDPHVFINLDQEFEGIKNQLLSPVEMDEQDPTLPIKAATRKDPAKAFALSNPFSKFLASKSKVLPNTLELEPKPSIKQFVKQIMAIHARNLSLLNTALLLLPPSSSAFIATPQEVANSSRPPPQQSQVPSVRTRRHRNLLIHNLLTDKPTFSSSLPWHRSQGPSSTFLKRGMPVTIIPDPTTTPWTPSSSPFSLSDPQLDLSHLRHLIEDSFGRKLDLDHYMARVKPRLAGVIIAGSYEGGAILTWETPPGRPTNDERYKVPYLDKFAVLKRSQGTGGVADIVFSSMVRECFPAGVCWRSRRNNPVNGWYFERAKGTWKIPGTQWTMFWTTPGVEVGDYEGRFGAYEGVCRAVEPSWTDNTGVVD